MLERLSIEVTNQCGKACWFCYAGSTPEGATRWTAGELVALVEDCARHGVRAVSFGGGEPLEYPGLFDVLRRLRGAVFRSVTTNGLHLEGGLLAELVAAAPDKVHVSIHFPADAERAIQLVAQLGAAGIRAGVNLLVPRSRLEVTAAAARKLRDAGIGNERIVYLPMRHQDTPAPREVAHVAGGERFQSMSCLARCAASPRFCSIAWDRSVAWCSYTRARRRAGGPAGLRRRPVPHLGGGTSDRGRVPADASAPVDHRRGDAPAVGPGAGAPRGGRARRPGPGIKIIYDGSTLAQALGSPRMERAVMQALAAEARRRGLWVAVHTGTAADVKEAVEAGAASIEHGVIDGPPLDGALLGQVKERGVTLVPTLLAEHLTVEQMNLEMIRRAFGEAAAAGVERWKSQDPLATVDAAVRRAFAAGVRIGVGTDANAPQMPLRGAIASELGLLVKAGLTPEQALLAATRDNAAALGAPDLGTIEPGKAADLILVDGQPWRDISQVSRVRHVVQDGRLAL